MRYRFSKFFAFFQITVSNELNKIGKKEDAVEELLKYEPAVKYIGRTSTKTFVTKVKDLTGSLLATTN